MIRYAVWEDVCDILSGTINLLVMSALLSAGAIALCWLGNIWALEIWQILLFCFGAFLILCFLWVCIENTILDAWYWLMDRLGCKVEVVVHGILILCAIALPFGLLYIGTDPNHYELYATLLGFGISLLPVMGFLLLCLWKLGKLAKWAYNKIRRHPPPRSSVMTI